MTDTEVQTIKISIFLANKLFTTLEAPIEKSQRRLLHADINAN